MRRRFVWWNVKGIDADTRGEREKEKRRTRREEKRRGMEGDAAVIIVLVASRLRTRRVRGIDSCVISTKLGGPSLAPVSM